MPRQITVYRTFIASPSGLEDVREAFRGVLLAHNESPEALYRGVMFLPVGWEQTLGGFGRPQDKINAELRECDYFILVFHDRWGSRTRPEGEEGPSSGSEEEFEVARELLETGSMREMLLFFRNVERGQLEDPGDELKKVLSFQQKVEAEKLFLYHRFDDVPAFEGVLRSQLSKWIYEHGESIKPPVTTEQEPVTTEQEPVTTEQEPVTTQQASVTLEAPVEARKDSPSSEVRDAEKLADEGKVIQAEQVFAKAVGGEDDLDAMNRYGTFLTRSGSLSRALDVFVELEALAKKQGRTEWQIATINNIAKIHEAEGRYAAADVKYKDGLRLREEHFGPGHPDVALSLMALAEVYNKQGRSPEAVQLLQRAIMIQGGGQAAS